MGQFRDIMIIVKVRSIITNKEKKNNLYNNKPDH